MNTVRPNENDILILWSLPKPGSDLLQLFRVYNITQRSGIPSYDELSKCFTLAVHAGMMAFPKSDKFTLFPEAYQQLHAWDDWYSVTEEGIWEHGHELTELQWRIVEPRAFVLDRTQYETAAAQLDRDWRQTVKEVMGRVMPRDGS